MPFLSSSSVQTRKHIINSKLKAKRMDSHTQLVKVKKINHKTSLNDKKEKKAKIKSRKLKPKTNKKNVKRKKIGFAIFQKRGWSRDEKEQVSARQFGRCNMCYREPSRWVYDHFDGDKRNNDISNCQGLCPKCKSEKMMIKV